MSELQYKLIGTGIGLLVAFPFVVWGAHSFWVDIKPDYSKLPERHRECMKRGLGLIASSGFLSLWPFPALFQPVMFFVSNVFLGVGVSLLAVSLFKLYEVQVNDKAQPDYHI